MRFGLILLLLLFAAFGAAFGALNSEGINFDFYFATLHLPKGAAMLCALLIGWLAGGLLVYFGLVLRLRRRLNRMSRDARRHEPKTAAPIETSNLPVLRKDP